MQSFEIVLIAIALPIGLALLGFWLWMLIDCIKYEPREGNDRLVWVLVIIFAELIGAAIYYFYRRPKRLQMNPEPSA